MREILFRGKRIDNGEWVEGFFVAKADPLLGIMASFILTQEIGDNGILRSNMAWYKVDAETVGQYTGLTDKTDKNGKKIFEGDIVTGLFSFGMEVKAVVAFQDGAFGLRWIRGGAEQFSAFTSICNVEFEVIGNIHDNPELLQDADKRLQRLGRWVFWSGWISNHDLRIDDAFCSECGYRHPTVRLEEGYPTGEEAVEAVLGKLAKECPGCGAKMIGGDENVKE